MSPDRSCRRRSLVVVIVLAGLGSSACRDEPRPPRTPVASPAAPGDAPVVPGLGTPSLPPGHPPLSSAGPGPALPADPAASIGGTVALAPSLESRVGPADVLYVIARDARTNAVVAVRREEGIKFPHPFQVSSADLMMEGTAFTGHFDVTARVSRTGDAIPAKGDLEGTVKGVAVGARAVSVTIDSVRQ